MGIAEQFRVAVGHLQESGDDAGPVLLPTRLSKACVQALPVVGAGLSLFSAPTMRIPVGASDDTADAAERLQFTVAQGPCFQAHHTGRPVVAPVDVIAEQWPLFHDELITHTAVRGIVSMPLPDGLSGVGVLDLYCRRPEDLARIDLGDVKVIAAQIATTLLAEDMFPTFRDGPLWEGPLWLNNPASPTGDTCSWRWASPAWRST